MNLVPTPTATGNNDTDNELLNTIVEAASDATVKKMCHQTERVTAASEDNKKTIASFHEQLAQQTTAFNQMSQRQMSDEGFIARIYSQVFPGATMPPRPGFLPTANPTSTPTAPGTTETENGPHAKPSHPKTPTRTSSDAL